MYFLLCVTASYIMLIFSLIFRPSGLFWLSQKSGYIMESSRMLCLPRGASRTTRCVYTIIDVGLGSRVLSTVSSCLDFTVLVIVRIVEEVVQQYLTLLENYVVIQSGFCCLVYNNFSSLYCHYSFDVLCRAKIVELHTWYCSWPRPYLF